MLRVGEEMAFSSSVSPEEVELACASGDVEKLYSLLSEVGDVANVANLTYNDGVTLFMKTIIGAGTCVCVCVRVRVCVCVKFGCVFIV